MQEQRAERVPGAAAFASAHGAHKDDTPSGRVHGAQQPPPCWALNTHLRVIRILPQTAPLRCRGQSPSQHGKLARPLLPARWAALVPSSAGIDALRGVGVL